MSNLVNGRTRSKYYPEDSNYQRFFNFDQNGLLTSGNKKAFIDLTSETDRVGLVDEIIVDYVEVSGTTPLRMTAEINSETFDFILPLLGAANTRRVVYRPRGRMVVPATKKLELYTTTGTTGQTMVQVKSRVVPVAKASNMGDYRGDSHVGTHGTITTGTEEVVVPAVEGMAVEITSFTLTGWSNATTTGKFTVEFWDESGTKRVIWDPTLSSAYQAANPNWGVVDKCVIRGPVGYGVYVEADANCDTDQVKFSCTYRYVQENKTYLDTGVPNTTGTQIGDRFWFRSAAVANGYTPFFPTAFTTGNDIVAVLEGYAISCQNTSGVAAATSSIATSATRPVSEQVASFNSGFASATNSDFGFFCPINITPPGFANTAPIAPFASQSALCWGRFLPIKSRYARQRGAN